MKTISLAIVLVAAVVIPAGAAAKPSENDRDAARKQCSAERGKTRATHEAFKASTTA